MNTPHPSPIPEPASPLPWRVEDAILTFQRKGSDYWTPLAAFQNAQDAAFAGSIANRIHGLLDQQIADAREILRLQTERANLTSEVSRLRSEVSRLSGARMVPLPETWEAVHLSRMEFKSAEEVFGGPKDRPVPQEPKREPRADVEPSLEPFIH